MSSSDVEALRKEAWELLQADPAAISLRSCWECNEAHEHLKTAHYVIRCFACGQVYFKGVNITTEPAE